MTDIKFQPFAKGSTLRRGGRSGTIDPRLSRTHYFDGQLLTASDLNRDQIYLDERMLEMGQILGSGVAKGLQASLYDNHMLRVTPGMAITLSGRVLQLSDSALEVNLQDSGVIATLNNGKYRRFRRGLYLIVLQYTEVIDGVAEVYPKDLNTRRWNVSAYAEGVKLDLVPLSLHLPGGDHYQARATLAQRLIWQEQALAMIPDDAVALGLLAMDHLKPLWLDRWLVYRPLRDADDVNARQQDLAAHYQSLFGEVQNHRRARGLPETFMANQYFPLLPPYGPLPKAAIDPVSGSQQYFPEGYEVTIAPVRRTDVPAILAEAEALTPMDLQRDEDADVMVLVPMSDQAFALRARQLEAAPVKAELFKTPSGGRLARLGGLSLRLFRRPPAHLLDTDTEAWKAIWEAAADDELLYVRRAPRTAETNVSGVILARGFDVPPLNVDLPPDPASIEAELDKALEEAANARDKATKLKVSSTKLKARITELEKALELDDNLALADALKKVQALEAKLREAEEKIKALSDDRNDITDMEATLEALRARIKDLQQQLDLARKRIAELESDSGATDADAAERNELLTRQLKEATDRNKKLEAENKRLTVLLKELQIKLEEFEQQNAELKERLKALGDDSDSSRSLIDELRKSLADREIELSKERTLLATTRSDLEKAINDRTEADKAAAAATSKLNDSLLELSKARTANNTLEVQLKERDGAVNSLQDQLRTSEKTTTELRLELAKRPALNESLSLTSLAKLRGADATTAAKLDATIGDNDEARLAVINILMRSDQSMDAELWPTLTRMALSNPDSLTEVNQKLATSTRPVTSTDVSKWNTLVRR